MNSSYDSLCDYNVKIMNCIKSNDIHNVLINEYNYTSITSSITRGFFTFFLIIVLIFGFISITTSSTGKISCFTSLIGLSNNLILILFNISFFIFCNCSNSSPISNTSSNCIILILKVCAITK